MISAPRVLTHARWTDVIYERLTECLLEHIHVLNLAVSECFGAGQCVGGKWVGCAVGLTAGLHLVLAVGELPAA